MKNPLRWTTVFLYAASLSLLCSCARGIPLSDGGSWTPVQCSIPLGEPPVIGMFAPDVEVRGWDIPLSFTSASDNVYGLSTGLGMPARNFCGLAVAGVNSCSYTCGLVVSGFTLAGTNAFWNIALENGTLENRGLQTGLFNISSNGVLQGNNRGVQLGMYNTSPWIRKEMKNPASGTSFLCGANFLQIGLMNQANHGWQFGGINLNRNSVLPVSLLFNYSGDPLSASGARGPGHNTQAAAERTPAAE